MKLLTSRSVAVKSHIRSTEP